MSAALGVTIDPTDAIKGAKAAIQAAQLMAQQMAASAKRLEDAMGNSSKNARGHLAKLASAVKASVNAIIAPLKLLMKTLALVGTAFSIFTGAMVAVRTAMLPFIATWNLLSGAIAGAADFEDYTVQFAQLLGTFEAADAKLAELSDIAQKTPFDLPGIVKGTITLQALSDGVLATRENILLVGDAAAKAKQPFEDMAEILGRVYIAARTGGEMIEELKTLTKQGVVDAATFVQLKALSLDGANEGGKNFKAIWDAMEQTLRRANGSMILMSETTNGLMSTLSDAWGEFQRTFGAALNMGLRPILRAMTQEIGTWTEKAKSIAPTIEAAAVKVAAFVNVLRSEGGVKLAWAAAMEEASDILRRGMEAAGIVFQALMKRAAYEFERILEKVTDPSFWKGLADALYNAAVEFVAVIKAGLLDVINKMTEGSWIAKMNPMISALKAGLTGAAAIEKRDTTRNAPNYVEPGNNPKTAPALVGFGEAWNRTGAGFNLNGAILSAQMGMEKMWIDQANAKSRQNSLLSPYRPQDMDSLPKVDKEAVAEAKKAAEDLERAAERVIAATRTPMEKYNETLRELQELQSKGLIDQETYTRAAAQAAEEYQNTVEQAAEASKKAMEEMQTPFQRLMQDWSDLNTRASEVSASIADNFANSAASAFTDFITGAKSAKESFGDMARAIIADIIQMITRMLIMKAISMAFGGGGVTAGVMHTGGTVGAAGASRTVPASTFGGAAKFQHGGTVGSGERPIIAEPGETVLTRSQSKDIKKRMQEGQGDSGKQPTQVTINNILDQSMLETALMQSDAIINYISRDRKKVKRILDGQ